ncbi:hypothetical protein HZC21_02900 [Candidatus Peregrinibacteria bacterium]|nr:hypothetical protein [Candidatus Peregrinibacteria bacterium]
MDIQRKQATIFFIFTLLLAGCVIAWVFFINKGALIIDGSAPFNVKIGASEMLCGAPPCLFKLSPRTHRVILSKKGFYDDAQNVKIKRWAEEKLTANFKFIPVYSEAGEIVLPVLEAPLRPPFLGTKKFEKFPKNVKQTEFSLSGNLALISIGKEFYIYYVADRIVDKTDLKPEMQTGWLGEEIVFLEESENKQFLRLRGEKQNKVLASFERPLKNPVLLGSPDAKKVLIAEKSDEKYFYYLVDTDKKSRKRLEISSGAQNPKWTGNYIVFEEGGGADKKVFALNADNLQKTELAAENSENIIEIKPDIFIFISSNKQDSSQAQIGMSITEALTEAAKNTASIIKKTTSWFITEFNVKTKESKMLVEIPATEGKNPHRLTKDLNGKKLYLDMNGTLIEITLEL